MHQLNLAYRIARRAISHTTRRVTQPLTRRITVPGVVTFLIFFYLAAETVIIRNGY